MFFCFVMFIMIYTLKANIGTFFKSFDFDSFLPVWQLKNVLSFKCLPMVLIQI